MVENIQLNQPVYAFDPTRGCERIKKGVVAYVADNAVGVLSGSTSSTYRVNDLYATRSELNDAVSTYLLQLNNEYSAVTANVRQQFREIPAEE